MKLTRSASWYRPYYITANNKGYLKCFVDGGIKYIRSLNKTEQKKMKLFV